MVFSEFSVLLELRHMLKRETSAAPIIKQINLTVALEIRENPG